MTGAPTSIRNHQMLERAQKERLRRRIERSFGLLLAGLTLAFFGTAWFSWRSGRWASRKMVGPSEVIQ